jgi:hypothetical protein
VARKKKANSTAHRSTHAPPLNKLVPCTNSPVKPNIPAHDSQRTRVGGKVGVGTGAVGTGAVGTVGAGGGTAVGGGAEGKPPVLHHDGGTEESSQMP